ncbi:MAG: MBOAT family protein [Candidatus Tumulicola sp.]
MERSGASPNSGIVPDSRRASVVAIAAGTLLFALLSVLMFWGALYRPLLDPASTTGAFESAIARLLEVRTDPRHDVLVLGDSRVYSGLNPAQASAAAGGHLRFLDGSVPGTTPRCWFFFVRAVDPRAARFRAIVIPVDTYRDDDSAIGSIDGDERQLDLHYVVFRAGLRDIPKLAESFPDSRTRLNVGTDLMLRGPELRDDAQAFAADPVARLQAIAQARTLDPYDPFAAHPRSQNLNGMRVDFARGHIVFPPSISEPERREIENQVLRVPHASPSYERYRRRWLGPIVARYAAAGVPVIFVRLPTRPAHRGAKASVAGSLLELARTYGARILPQEGYLVLERPGLFADHDHLNAGGSAAFSAELGRDVERAIADRAASVTNPESEPSRPPNRSNGSPWRAAREALGIGVPLTFQSYEFWIFFALVAALFYTVASRFRRFVLLAASYYFYARWNAWYVLFLWILTISDYAIAIALERASPTARKVALVAGVAANLAFLSTFKYVNFASGTIAALIGMHANPWLVSLIVPIGISFHTFQSISYIVDVYRGKMRAVRDPFDYALYLAFFPQLLAGPIVRAGLFFSELFAWRKPSAEDVGYGCMRVGFGLVKKIAIADQFAQVSNAYFDSVATHPGSLAAIGTVFAFSMQIYFDFSGYSDIAIGCARLLGFVFPENFAQPYLATSITDFWHRWHITLSTWLRDYLYIPLGGSRNGLSQTLRNLMLTMLLGGLWHGSQWTFVAWGGYHGVLLSLERVFRIGRAGDEPRGMVYLLRISTTFVAVSLGWVLFRAPSFGVVAQVYRQLLAGGWQGWPLHGWQAVLSAGIVVYALIRLAAMRRRVDLSWNAFPLSVRAGTLAALLIALELFSWPGAPATFIYFKF